RKKQLFAHRTIGPVKARIGRYSDHLAHDAIARISQVPADRILPRPELASRGLIDDRYRVRAGYILGSEGTPGHDWHAQRLEVIGAGVARHDARILARAKMRRPLNEDEEAKVRARHGQVTHGARRLHPG